MADAPQDQAPAKKAPAGKTIAWVVSTYFAEGLPYIVARVVSGIYFTEVGVKETYIGLLNWLGIPWTAKFAWSPFVDSIASKRKWMVAAQAIIALSMIALAISCWSSSGGGSMSFGLVVTCFIVMAIASATNDVAIDGYYLEGLTEKSDQALYSGHRIMAYRLATIFATSGLVGIAALAADYYSDKQIQWSWAFGAGGLTMLALALHHATKLPKFAERKVEGSVGSAFTDAFASYMKQDKIVISLLFVLLYKLGDEMLLSMISTFQIRDLGVTTGQISWIRGWVGAAGGLAGAYVAGFWAKGRGLKSAMFPMMILMNVNILTYAWLATVKPDPKTVEGLSIIATAWGFEQFTMNMGFAGLVLFLMRLCKPEHKAAHYAIGSGISSIGSLLGGAGGWIVENYGYRNLFLLAFVLSLPAMILFFWVPMREEPKPV